MEYVIGRKVAYNVGVEEKLGYLARTQSQTLDTLSATLTPLPLATFRNVPVVTLFWVAFFIVCFFIFLILSLCSGMRKIDPSRLVFVLAPKASRIKMASN